MVGLELRRWAHLLVVLFAAAGCGREVEVPAQAAEPTSAAKAAPAKNKSLATTVSSNAQTQATSAPEWPRWRGPNFDGVSDETGWNAEWTEPPKKLWEAKVGIGYSSVAVAGGRLFTMGHNGRDDEPQETVWCLDAVTGREIWKHTYPGKLINNLHEGGPAATPTVHAQVVYTLGKEGQLFCFKAATGEVIWERACLKELGVSLPDWGFASSPLVWRDLVIVDVGRVAAYDKRTGELKWKTEAFPAGYGSVVSFEHQGEELLALMNNAFLLVLRPTDGSEVARYGWETSYKTNACTPQVIGDTIFVSTGYRRGCALMRLADGKLETIYENKAMSNHMNNCVLWDGHLFGFNGNSHERRLVTLSCLDLATGVEQWKERELGVGALMIAGGKLVILSDEGELVIAEPSPTQFKPLARAKILSGTCWTVPVLVGGKVYARNAAGNLVCVDLGSPAAAE